MKTYIITPLFCKAMLFYDQLKHMQENSLLTPDMVHVAVNDRYPIDQKINDELLFRFARAFNCVFVVCNENMGMQKAINLALDFIKPNDEDVIILSDADDRATPDSYQALRDVITANDEIAVAALSFNQIWKNRIELNPLPSMAENADIDYWIHPSVDCWHIAAYRYSWIKSIGGFGQVYPYWGGLESYLYSKWKPQKKRLVYLYNYSSWEPSLEPYELFFDKEFQHYKKCIHETKYQGSFAEWLRHSESK